MPRFFKEAADRSRRLSSFVGQNIDTLFPAHILISLALDRSIYCFVITKDVKTESQWTRILNHRTLPNPSPCHWYKDRRKVAGGKEMKAVTDIGLWAGRETGFGDIDSRRQISNNHYTAPAVYLSILGLSMKELRDGAGR